MRSLKLIIFFLRNIFDLKFDFPFPPKFFFRVLDYTYWKTLFIQYYQRKNEKIILRKNKPRTNYNDWLYKTFNVQYNTIVNENFFDEISKKSKKIFEGGVGSGSACACFISFYLEKYKNKKIKYYGIDINTQRIFLAKKFLKKFIGENKNIGIKLKYANLKKIPFAKNYFDYSFLPSVLERIDNKNIENVIGEICRVTNKGVYISDLYDKLPNGTPRSHKIYQTFFLRNGFEMKNFKYLIKKPKRKEYIGNHCILQMMFVKKQL